MTIISRSNLRLIGRKNLCPSATSESKPPRSKTVAVIQNTILILEQFGYLRCKIIDILYHVRQNVDFNRLLFNIIIIHTYDMLIMINKTSLNFLLLDTSVIEDFGNQTNSWNCFWIEYAVIPILHQWPQLISAVWESWMKLY